MERRGQELAVSISPDSVASGPLAQLDRQPNPPRFRTFNQGGDVGGAGAGVGDFVAGEEVDSRLGAENDFGKSDTAI